MKKYLVITIAVSIFLVQTSCAVRRPSELKRALSYCRDGGGKECFERWLGPADVTGWTDSGEYYMKWEGQGISQSASPYETKYGGGGLECLLPSALLK